MTFIQNIHQRSFTGEAWDCLYVSKDLKSLYINSGPDAKSEQGMYKIPVKRIGHVEEGDVFQFKGTVWDVERGGRLDRSELRLEDKEAKEILQKVENLFPRVNISDKKTNL